MAAQMDGCRNKRHRRLYDSEQCLMLPGLGPSTQLGRDVAHTGCCPLLRTLSYLRALSAFFSRSLQRCGSGASGDLAPTLRAASLVKDGEPVAIARTYPSPLSGQPGWPLAQPPAQRPGSKVDRPDGRGGVCWHSCWFADDMVGTSTLGKV